MPEVLCANAPLHLRFCVPQAHRRTEPPVHRLARTSILALRLTCSAAWNTRCLQHDRHMKIVKKDLGQVGKESIKISKIFKR